MYSVTKKKGYPLKLSDNAERSNLNALINSQMSSFCVIWLGEQISINLQYMVANLKVQIRVCSLCYSNCLKRVSSFVYFEICDPCMHSLKFSAITFYDIWAIRELKHSNSNML